MESAGLGSNPTSTILRSTDVRTLGSRLLPCSSHWPVPRMIHQGGLPGILKSHLSPLTHHRCVQTMGKPCQSQLAKGPQEWEQVGQGDHWRLSSKTRLLGPALACYKERSHPASGQDPSAGGHPTPRALNPIQWLLDLPSSFLALTVPFKDERGKQGLVRGSSPENS